MASVLYMYCSRGGAEEAMLIDIQTTQVDPEMEMKSVCYISFTLYCCHVKESRKAHLFDV